MEGRWILYNAVKNNNLKTFLFGEEKKREIQTGENCVFYGHLIKTDWLY